MVDKVTRRDFLGTAAIATAALATQSAFAEPPRGRGEPLFRISLAEWSLHRALFRHEVTNLDFPEIARREYGIGACEYVNQFFKDKAHDEKYLAELNRRAAAAGVKNVLIMIDDEGRSAIPTPNVGLRPSTIITSGSMRPRSWAAIQSGSTRTATDRTMSK